jgi:hypothetical protein
MLRQEDCEFEASLSYVVRPYLKKTKNEKYINKNHLSLKMLLKKMILWP